MTDRRALALAAVLVVDMCDSTQRRIELGDERADQLALWLERLLAAEVDKEHGRVVQALGDGVYALFATASEAIASAGAMQRAVRRRRQWRDIELEIRVGVSAGEVSVEPDAARGLPVIEAFRLCDVATPRQIVVSEMARRLALGRVELDTIDLGERSLKGLGDPARCHAVVWDRPESGDARIIPPALGVHDSLTMVGRDGEVESLVDEWKQAMADRRRVVLVAGEPGAGKTRLARELARALPADDAVVLYGQCAETVASPLGPFIECLRFYLGAYDRDEIVSQLGSDALLLARVAPELASAFGMPHAVDTTTDAAPQARVFEAWTRFFAAASTLAPMLVIIDDLHWADAPTLQLLRAILDSDIHMRALFVGNYRSTEIGLELTALLAHLRRHSPNTTRITLAGLGVSEATELLLDADRAIDRHRAEAVAARIVAQTKGNPLFVTELIRHRALDDDAGGTRLPSSLREVVRGRLARLDPHVNALLSVAAVFGTTFDAREVAQCLGEPIDDVLSYLTVAVRAGLLDELGDLLRFRFSHGLVRTGLYDELTVTERVRLHYNAGLAIERGSPRLDERAAELAHHYFLARALDGDRAWRSAVRAGDRAGELQAHDEACRWYRRALQVHDDQGRVDRDRVDVLLALGRAQMRSGDIEASATLRAAGELAERLGTDDALADAALATSRGFFSQTGVVDRDQLDLLERALRKVGDGDSARRAGLLALLASELVWDDPDERRFALSEQAVAMALRVRDHPTAIRALLLRLVAIDTADTLPERSRTAEQLVQLVSRDGNDELAFQALFYAWRVRMECGDTADHRSRAEELAMVADRTRQPAFRWLAGTVRACSAIFDGRLAEAGKHAHDALRFGKQAGRHGEAWLFFGEQLFEIRRLEGRLGETIEAARGIEAIPTGLHALVYGYLFDGGHGEEATRRYRADFEGGVVVRRAPGELALIDSYSDVAARIGDREHAATLYERLAPYAEHVALSTVVWPAGAHFLGALARTLGDERAAIEHLERACEIHERIGAPLLLARSRLALSAIVDRSRADRLIADARDDALACGALGLVAAADAAADGRASLA